MVLVEGWGFDWMLVFGLGLLGLDFLLLPDKAIVFIRFEFKMPHFSFFLGFLMSFLDSVGADGDAQIVLGFIREAVP